MLFRFIALVFFPLILFGFGGFPKFLTPDQAFKPTVTTKDSKIIAKVELADKIYIYKKSLKFFIKSPEFIEIAKIDAPPTIDHDGDAVYEGTPVFTIELRTRKPLNQKEIEVSFEFGFQGCSSAGLCYEPQTKLYTLKVDTAKILSKTPPTTQNVPQTSKADAIANTLKNGSLWVIIASFFGFGLLLALTPCVFPMIPIISGLIVSQGKEITTKKAFFLSLVYVLAMAVAYTIAGVLAGLFGSNLQAALQNPYVVVVFSGVFVALAMSMFGYFELKLPDSFVAKVSQKGQGRGGFVGVALMGFLSALIVGPCVAAPLAGALIYIGQSGDALLGAVALFAMSMGMGLPLIIVGVGAGKLMPRPGAWMTLVNALFGMMMLGVAIWMLEKIIPVGFAMVLWAFLALGSALYLGALQKETHIFQRTVAFGLLLYAMALFVGFFAGHYDRLSPLGFLKQTQTQAKTAQQLSFEVVENLDQLQTLLVKNKGKKIMIDFSAAWCTACKELEETTFKDPQVIAKLKEYVLIRADVTKNKDQQKVLSKAYGVFGPPVMIFIDESGKVQKGKTIVGYVEPKEFLKHL